MKKTCPICKMTYELPDIERDDRPIQESHPHLSPIEREKYISGMCETCQNIIFRW